MSNATLMQEVAANLSGTQSPLDANRENEAGYITLIDGVKLFYRIGGYALQGRIEFSGAWPSYTDNGGSRQIVTPRSLWIGGHQQAAPEITVSDKKTPVQIARDIERRLLPHLRPLWLEAQKRCDSYTAYHTRHRDTCTRVAKDTGGKLNSQGNCVSWGYEVGSAEYRGGAAPGEVERFKLTLENVSESQIHLLLSIMRFQPGKRTA